jgi:hypothetical protein
MFRKLILVFSILPILCFAYLVGDVRRWDMEDFFIAFYLTGYPSLVFFYVLKTRHPLITPLT